MQQASLVHKPLTQFCFLNICRISTRTSNNDRWQWWLKQKLDNNSSPPRPPKWGSQTTEELETPGTETSGKIFHFIFSRAKPMEAHVTCHFLKIIKKCLAKVSPLCALHSKNTIDHRNQPPECGPHSRLSPSYAPTLIFQRKKGNNGTGTHMGFFPRELICCLTIIVQLRWRDPSSF